MDVSTDSKYGGESHKVYELSPSVVFEIEAFPEPKCLSGADLAALYEKFRSTIKLADHVGASQSFVAERLNPSRKWDPKSGQFQKLKKPKASTPKASKKGKVKNPGGKNA